MPDLAGGDQRFRADLGGADPVVASALAAFADGSGSEHAALTALAGSRLLVPVVAVVADELDAGAGGGPGDAGPGEQPELVRSAGEKTAEMAMPAIVGRDGRRALPAFTCLETLSLWQPAGRPVPVPASSVWQSAVQECCAVVIDIAGPVPVAVDGARLTALAGGQCVPWLHEDPDVWQLAAAVAAEHAPGIRVRLSAPRSGLDLTVELAPPAGASGQLPDRVTASIGESLSARLADRAPRGITVLARAASSSDGDRRRPLKR